jgi:hypothetical protein
LIDALRPIKPGHLFVIADGPRPNRPDDIERCTATRAVIDTIDWECELVKNYAPLNLGCGRRVSSGLAWLFEQVDEAIILEDDCLPDPTFFPFCQALLDRYRDDERVMMIGGCNPLDTWRAETQSYHFAHFGLHWGWATWRRAWSHYDFNMTPLAEPTTPQRLLDVLGDPEQVDFQLDLCAQVADHSMDTWDFQWNLGQLLRDGLTVYPAVNLVTNTGFGTTATHTRTSLSMSAWLERHSLTFPLITPPTVEADREFDHHYIAWQLGRPNLEMILTRVSQRATNHPVQALLMLEAVLRSTSNLPETDWTRLTLLKARVLMALGRRERALETARAALARYPQLEEAAALVREFSYTG